MTLSVEERAKKLAQYIRHDYPAHDYNFALKWLTQELSKDLQSAIKEEREACAKIAERCPAYCVLNEPFHDPKKDCGQIIAQAILKRGEEQ